MFYKLHAFGYHDIHTCMHNCRMSSKAKKASVQATGTKSKSQGSSAGKKTKSEK